ncbi:MAG: Ig-like domain-containing protein [bacterium]
MRFARTCLGSVLVLATACQQSDHLTSAILGDPPGVAVSPPSATVRIGATVGLTASITDLPGVTITWVSSDTTVAVVSQGGTVSGRAVGTTTVTASYFERSGTAVITVVP